MRQKNKVRLINLLMKDGTAHRVPIDRAEELLSRGQAKRYISNTIYKAINAGINVKNLDDRDEDGKLKAQIRKLKEKAVSKKSEQPEEELEPIA